MLKYQSFIGGKMIENHGSGCMLERISYDGVECSSTI